jgi:hypothetical protein
MCLIAVLILTILLHFISLPVKLFAPNSNKQMTNKHVISHYQIQHYFPFHPQKSIPISTSMSISDFPVDVPNVFHTTILLSCFLQLSLVSSLRCHHYGIITMVSSLWYHHSPMSVCPTVSAKCLVTAGCYYVLSVDRNFKPFHISLLILSHVKPTANSTVCINCKRFTGLRII